MNLAQAAKAWVPLIRRGLKGLGLSEQSEKVLLRQIADIAGHDPWRAQQIIKELRGPQWRIEDEEKEDDDAK